MKHLYIILITTLLLSACADDRRVVSLLDHAETLMDSLPDSAQTLLMEADSLIPRQSEKIRMRHAVLMAEANNKLYLPLPPDTIFQEVVDYYDHHGTPNQQLKAHYLLGCIYRDRDEAPQALQCYQEAIEKADTLNADCDYNTLYKIYGQMADVLHNQIMPKEEVEALKRYSKYSLKAGNMYEHIRSYEYMASAYSLLGDTTMILSLEKQARKLFIQYGFTQAAAHACTISIHIYLDRGEYGKAKEMMEQYQKCSGLFDADGNIEPGWEQYYDAQGKYYMGTGNLDSAQYYFRKLLNHKNSFDGYRGLMHISMKKGMADSVIFYAQEYEKSIDTLVTEVHAQATRQALGMYNYSRHQRMAIEKEKEAENEKMAKWGVFFIAIFLVLMGTGWYVRYRKQKKAEIQQLGIDYTNAITKLLQTKEELHVLQNSYSNLKERALAIKQEEIERLNALVQDYQSKYDAMAASEKEMALRKSDIVQAFKKMACPKLHPQFPSESDWEKLTMSLQQCMPIFYQKIIQEPHLAGQELYTTVLTRLHFSPSEIAYLLNTSPQRITNVKKHVNHKLFGAESATSFMKNLEASG